MVEFTYAQLQGLIATFIWPLSRITGLMLTDPLFGHSGFPRQAKITFAAAVAFVITPVLPPMPDVPLYSWTGFGIIVEQLLIGAAIGMTVRVMLSAVLATGEFIGLQMGLAFAVFFDPSSGVNLAVLSRLLYMITLLMFLAFNGHLIVIEILVTSFETLPVGMGGFNADGFIMLARYGGTIFVTGMLLALPLMGALLTISLSLGILNRSAPQLTIFNIGFPTSLTLGLVLLMVLMTDIAGFLERMFARGMAFLQNLLETMAPLPVPG